MRTFLSAAAAFGVTALTLAAPVAAHAGALNWSGDVDDTAIVHISHDRVWTTSSMKGVRNESSDVRGRLDDRRDRIRVARVQGRGNVQVIEQPNRRNHYTAAVRIRDYQPGAGHYHVVLTW